MKLSQIAMLGLACAVSAVNAQVQGDAPPSATSTSIKPQPDWVFNGKGQKTDQPAIVNLKDGDTLYPISLNNHWGMMNQAGDIIVYPRFEWTDYAYDGYARFIEGGKTGFLRANDPNDERSSGSIIKAQYDYADRFSNGVAVVMNKDKWGLIDKAGKTLLAMEYDGVLRMQDGFSVVQRGGKCGYINRAGKLAIPMRYQAARSFHHGFAAVQLPTGRWAYIDKRGKQVWADTAGRVDRLGDFHGNYARVRVQDNQGKLRWAYMTRAFRLAVPARFEEAGDFHNGLAAVKEPGGKWGYIDGRGRWAIEPAFDEADAFDDAERSNDFDDDERKRAGRNERKTAGLYAMVKVGDRWGYIDRRGKGGLKPQFTSAQPFFRGLARVARDDSFAYIGETGKVRFDPRVTNKLGMVLRTNAEKARLSNPDIYDGIANQVVPAPRPVPAWNVPYGPDRAFDEQLPIEED